MSRPLIVAGALAERIALPPDIPVLAEPISQCRLVGTITAYEALVRSGWADAHRPTEVIRVGAAPTSRVLNEWLAGLSLPYVAVDPDGLRRDPDGVATAFVDALPALPSVDAGWVEGWREAERTARAALDRALSQTLHEGAVIGALARALPEPATVFLGSSLPVRDADWFWPAAPAVRFLGNRGASGIDGLVSTGLGVAAASAEPTVLLLGDLSLYHDMNGLWAVRRHGVRATIVVLDNGGGGIFEFLPPARHRDVFEEIFATPLGLDFERVASLYGLEHILVESVDQLQPSLETALRSDSSHLVQVRFSRAQSVAGHRAAWEAVAAALS
ncbi:MAG TPA: thiamine pyrophosphate-dependent enzyme [Candidatus Dormibacteraeota bacterium]